MTKISDKTELASFNLTDKIMGVDVSETLNKNKNKYVQLSTLKTYVGYNTYYAEKSVSSANLLSSNSSPVEVVAAPGAGYGIQFLCALGHYDYGTAAYATETDIMLIMNGIQITATIDVLGNTSDRWFIFNPGTFDSYSTVVTLENKALQLKAETLDPTGGDGTLNLYVIYRLVSY